MNIKFKRILLVILTAIFLVIGFFIFKATQYSPLDEYDFTDCKIGVCDWMGKDVIEYLGDEESEKLIQLLNNVELYGKETTEWHGQEGYMPPYRFELKDGSVVNISNANNYLIINGKGYKCKNEEDLIMFNKYMDDVYCEIFEDISETDDPYNAFAEKVL